MSNSISVPILINHDESKETVETLGLLDSGAGGQFIDQNYAKKAGFKIKKLDKPLRALNVDGTKNKRGTITSFVELKAEINKKQMNLHLLVTGFGKQRIILSFPWLNTTQKSTGKWEISLGEKQRNHDDSSRSKDAIHANPFY